ncbi:MAG: hypothetical protein ACI9DC_000582 [Gammaproteobacteria bacterium]|jgi:hypothetical protein
MGAKIIVVVVLIAILASLGTALFHMVKGGGSSKQTARALTVRIGVSLALFALLLILGATGVISPHGITP